MAYASWSVSFGEQPSAAKWNILGTNDSVFNNGTGLPTANAATATVATTQTTASTSYTDLATAGPSVTVTVGSTGLVLVLINSELANNTNNDTAKVSFVVSGANTLAASDANGMYYGLSGAANSVFREGTSCLLTGLVAGSTTFKMQYRVDAGTGTFGDRTIIVIPL